MNSLDLAFALSSEPKLSCVVGLSSETNPLDKPQLKTTGQPSKPKYLIRLMAIAQFVHWSLNGNRANMLKFVAGR